MPRTGSSLPTPLRRVLHPTSAARRRTGWLSAPRRRCGRPASLSRPCSPERHPMISLRPSILGLPSARPRPGSIGRSPKRAAFVNCSYRRFDPVPLIHANGAELFCDLTGPAAAPVVVFSNSLGTTLEMWDAQVRALAPRYRCLRYDTRGHGRSPAVEGPVTVEALADDMAGLLDA